MLKSINNLDITQNYKKSIKQPQSINFKAKELPIKQITDKGLKAASSAIASLGIASIALNSKQLPQDDGLVTFNVSDEQWKELIPTLAENITQKNF